MSRSVTLTPEEAARAIYLDFEGTEKEDPSLLGSVFVPGRRLRSDQALRYQVDILEPALAPAVDAVVNNGRAAMLCRCRSITTALSDLVGRAEKQDRWLVSWSERERDAVRDARLPHDLAARFDARWVNGIGMAKRWKAQDHPHVTFDRDVARGRHQLVRYFDLAGYAPSEMGRATAPSDAIRRVRKGLARAGAFDGLTSGQKEQWLGLIAHNFDDCAGMRQVLISAAAALA